MRLAMSIGVLAFFAAGLGQRRADFEAEIGIEVSSTTVTASPLA